jgi:hypothetical protein
MARAGRYEKGALHKTGVGANLTHCQSASSNSGATPSVSEVTQYGVPALFIGI